LQKIPCYGDKIPWERLIGTLRRECVDHVIALGEAHLRRVLIEFAAYYNASRIHRALDKDAPLHRAIESVGIIHHFTTCSCRPSSRILPGLNFSTLDKVFGIHTDIDASRYTDFTVIEDAAARLK
jgi:Integrase core domain